MGTFEERAAQNETLFRSVNEEIEKLGQVESKSGGKMSNALERLKAMRGGGEKKDEEKK